jgi:hypothetical protein
MYGRIFRRRVDSPDIRERRHVGDRRESARAETATRIIKEKKEVGTNCLFFSLETRDGCRRVFPDAGLVEISIIERRRDSMRRTDSIVMGYDTSVTARRLLIYHGIVAKDSLLPDVGSLPMRKSWAWMTIFSTMLASP